MVKCSVRFITSLTFHCRWALCAGNRPPWSRLGPPRGRRLRGPSARRSRWARLPPAAKKKKWDRIKIKRFPGLQVKKDEKQETKERFCRQSHFPTIFPAPFSHAMSQARRFFLGIFFWESEMPTHSRSLWRKEEEKTWEKNIVWELIGRCEFFSSSKLMILPLFFSRNKIY